MPFDFLDFCLHRWCFCAIIIPKQTGGVQAPKESAERILHKKYWSGGALGLIIKCSYSVLKLVKLPSFSCHTSQNLPIRSQKPALRNGLFGAIILPCLVERNTAPGEIKKTIHSQFWRYLLWLWRRTLPRLCSLSVRWMPASALCKKKPHLNFRRKYDMKMMKNLTKSMQSYGEMLTVIGG